MSGVAALFQVPTPTVTKATKYALVIGISDYEGAVNDLQHCDVEDQDWIAYLPFQGNQIVFAYSGHGSKAT